MTTTIAPADVTIGQGRVPYAPATDLLRSDGSKLILPAGWVLPGGRRTIVREHAVAAAIAMDRMLGRRK